METNFEKIFQYLNNPYALVGFIVMLFVSIIWLLIKKKSIKPNTRTFRLIIMYTFVISIIAIITGTILQYLTVRPIKTESEILELKRIPDLEQKKKTFFANTAPGENVKLKFVSVKYDFDVDFEAPLNMTVRELKENIIRHFGFDKLLLYDSSYMTMVKYVQQNSSVEFWHNFKLLLNYKEVPEVKNMLSPTNNKFSEITGITLGEAGFKTGSILSLKLEQGITESAVKSDFGNKTKDVDDLKNQLVKKLAPVNF